MLISVFLFIISIIFFDLFNLVFKPIKFNNSIMVKISFAKGIFLIDTLLARIEAARIGNSFLDPDIEIFRLILAFDYKLLHQ